MTLSHPMPQHAEYAAGPGSYVLVLHLEEPSTCRIGALGVFDFPAGYYLYVGSALGPGGLAGRVGRHLRREKRLHWHIDYLLEVAEVVDVWTEPGKERLECAWARRLLDAGGKVIAPGFGASDCHCPAHLVYVGEAVSDQLSVVSDQRSAFLEPTLAPMIDLWLRTMRRQLKADC